MYRVEENWGSGGCGYTCKTTKEVYDALVEKYGHDEAANIEDWCKHATIGEEYSKDGILVYIVDEQNMTGVK